MKRDWIARVLDATGIRRIAGGITSWSGVLCLNYHRIGSANGSPFDHGLWSADEEAFDFQVRFLKSYADIVRPEDLSEVRTRNAGRFILITFDDGYRDNFTAAFPILKRNGVPATFFIGTGFLDSPKLPWWDEIAWMIRTSAKQKTAVPPWVPETIPLDTPKSPHREEAVRIFLRAFKAMPSTENAAYLTALSEALGTGRYVEKIPNELWMTWDMVREMRANGMSFGGHTVSHPILSRMPHDQQFQEIVECGRRFEKELGEPMRWFSYPVGSANSFDARTRDSLKRAGVTFAFSYYGGYRTFGNWDDYDIRRVAIESYTSPALFKSIVSLPQFFAG